MYPKHCTACGEELVEGASFCGTCGARVEAEAPVATTPSGYCSACGAALSAGAPFCGSCGAAVETEAPLRCPACGADSPAGAEFCGACGTPLAPPAPAPEMALQPRKTEGEVRPEKAGGLESCLFRVFTLLVGAIVVFAVTYASQGGCS